jgi:hypothetical protein
LAAITTAFSAYFVAFAICCLSPQEKFSLPEAVPEACRVRPAPIPPASGSQEAKIHWLA